MIRTTRRASTYARRFRERPGAVAEAGAAGTASCRAAAVMTVGERAPSRHRFFQQLRKREAVAPRGGGQRLSNEAQHPGEKRRQAVKDKGGLVVARSRAARAEPPISTSRAPPRAPPAPRHSASSSRRRRASAKSCCWSASSKSRSRKSSGAAASRRLTFRALLSSNGSSKRQKTNCRTPSATSRSRAKSRWRSTRRRCPSTRNISRRTRSCSPPRRSFNRSTRS